MVGDDPRNSIVPEIIVQDEEDAGEDAKSLPEVSPESNSDSTENINNRSPPIMSGYSPSNCNNIDFTDELPEKLQKIHVEADQLPPFKECLH